MSVRRTIAKIASTELGRDEATGRLTAWLNVFYGDTETRLRARNRVQRQGIGGVELIGDQLGGFIAGVLAVCAEPVWERVAGRTVYVLHDLPDGAGLEGAGMPVGLEPLPTEDGVAFMFAELAQPAAELEAGGS